MQSSGQRYLRCCIKTSYLSQKHGGLVGSDVMLAPFPCGSLLLCHDHLEIRIVEFFCLRGLSTAGETERFSNATFGSRM